MKTTYPDGTTESRSYDSVGNLIGRTTPAGVVISYSYDSANRLTKVAYPDATTLAYSWDSNGNVLSIIGASASTFYAYNPRNWVSNQTEVVGGKRYPVLYGYDNVGNIVTTAYPDGYALSISYDVFNRVHQLGTFATFLYTVDGKLSRISYGDEQVAEYSYDSRERPTRILVRTGSVTQLDLNYTYDSVGNVLSIDGQRYSYDWLNRLTSARGTWLPISYSYDGAGNVVNETVGTTTMSHKYGVYNRLTSAGSVSFSYDANGNTVTKVNGSTSWSYAYDFENRLTIVQKNAVTVAKNLYDGAGNMVVSVEGGTQQAFGYQGINRIYATNLNSSSTADSFYANGLLVASRNASAVSYDQEDAIGSVRLATNSGGIQSYSSNYKPFGTSYGTAGSSSVGYAGKPSDSVTGLYYFGARWYDPTVERFITQDSVGGGRADPLSLNRYIYARDNPLGITDPTGHDWFSDLTGAISNTASYVVSTLTTTASAVTNAWNSLPPPVQIGIGVAAVVAIGVATGGLGDVAIAAAGAISESAGSIVAGAAVDGAIGSLSVEGAIAAIGGAATEEMTAATPEEEAGFAAFEQQVFAQGPKAIGAYGEEVYKGYLENLGLDFEEQVPFQGMVKQRTADFVIKQLGNIRNVAVDVKTSGIWSYNEHGLASIDKSQLADYVYAQRTNQFGAILYANVPIVGRYGFTSLLQGVLSGAGVAFKAPYQ